MAEFAPLDSASTALPYRPDAPFFLTHFAEDRGNWYLGTVDGVTYWLPHLRRRNIVPGAGVRTRRSESEPLADTYEGLVAKLRKQGHSVILETHELRYVTRYAARHPVTGESGYLHCPFWAVPRPARLGARNAGVVKYDVDVAARDLFAYNLVADGLIPGMSAQTLREIGDRSAARIDRRIAQDVDRLGTLPPVGSDEWAALDVATLPRAVRPLAEQRLAEQAAAVIPPPQRAARVAGAAATPRTGATKRAPKDPADG